MYNKHKTQNNNKPQVYKPFSPKKSELQRRKDSEFHLKQSNPHQFHRVRQNQPRRRHIEHLPPEVVREEAQQNIIISLLTSVIQFGRSLNKTQLIGLCLLALIAGAAAIDALQRNTQNNSNKKTRSNKESKALRERVYKESCTTVDTTFNKPTNITLGAKGGMLLPKSCVIGDVAKCINDSNTVGFFKPDFTALSIMRAKVNNAHQGWSNLIQLEIQQIQVHHNSQQKIIFDNIVTRIANLKRAKLSTEFMRQMNKGGNCGEHTYKALTTLLHKKIQHSLDMKIQFVMLYSSMSSQSINDHVYLLLDSNVDEVTINNNKIRVKQFLDSISTGTICDPWNHGYYADFTTDNSGFYNSVEAGWDHLTVETYELTFKGFNMLHEKAQRFICKTLSSMGWYVEPREVCRMFRKPAEVVIPMLPPIESGTKKDVPPKPKMTNL